MKIYTKEGQVEMEMSPNEGGWIGLVYTDSSELEFTLVMVDDDSPIGKDKDDNTLEPFALLCPETFTLEGIDRAFSSSKTGDMTYAVNDSTTQFITAVMLMRSAASTLTMLTRCQAIAEVLEASQA